MGMYATENNEKTAAEILNILAKNKCTVADALDILSFCGSAIKSRATVPDMDYLKEFNSHD